MGILRFLFAVNVLFSHTISGFAGGVVTVPSFYILSGFYMALVLNEKYIKKNKGYMLFISNRFLRILPLYWVVLFLLIGLALFKFFFQAGEDNAIYHILNVSSQSPIVLVNYIFRNLTLIITSDYVTQFNDRSGEYLLVQQAPTLQVELLFYLIAPFIARFRIKKLVLVSVCYGLLYIVVTHSFLQHTLTYNFMANGVFFLLGIAAYRLYKSGKWQGILKKHIQLVTSFFLLWSVLFTLGIGIKIIPDDLIVQGLYYVSLVCFIPVIFLWVKKLDVIFGELSYPIYLSHFLIIKIFHNTLGSGLNQYMFTGIVFAITLIVSYLLMKMVEIPIDKMRQMRLRG